MAFTHFPGVKLPPRLSPSHQGSVTDRGVEKRHIAAAVVQCFHHADATDVNNLQSTDNSKI